MRRFLTMTAIAALIAPGVAESKPPSTPAFEVFRYRLPATQIIAHLSLTLEKCDTLPVVSGTMNLEAKAGAGAASFAVTDAALASARIKRDLAITFHDTGTIATIDSKVEDRTGAIIGNIIKTIGSILTFGVLGGPKLTAEQVDRSTVCTSEVRQALNQVEQLTVQINTLSNSLAGLTPKDPLEQRAKIASAIKTLAAHRAALRTGLLHVDLDAALDLASTGTEILAREKQPYTLGGSTMVDISPLVSAWIAADKNAADKLGVKLAWQAYPASITFDPRNEANKGKLPDAKCGEPGVGDSICIVRPERARFIVAAELAGIASVNQGDSLAADIAAPMGQWGEVSRLGLRAGFGETRAVSFVLDKFGRKTEAKWSSDARAENVTGTFAGITGQIAEIAQANSSIARQKSEIEALTTQQTLNRMRACKEILAAGGSECPAEASVTE